MKRVDFLIVVTSLIQLTNNVMPRYSLMYSKKAVAYVTAVLSTNQIRKFQTMCNKRLVLLPKQNLVSLKKYSLFCSKFKSMQLNIVNLKLDVQYLINYYHMTKVNEQLSRFIILFKIVVLRY